MAEKGKDGEDAANYKAVFVDTNLDTHLAIPVSSLDTIFDLKGKILTEHSKCFEKIGEIEVHDLKVKRKGKLYSVSDVMPVTSVFSWSAKGWFLFADISNRLGHYKTVDHNNEFLSNPHTPRLLMLTDHSPASQFQRRYEKEERNLRTENLSGEARSENMQLVAGFKSDDNFKSSSSDTDKRLNALVEDIYNASCEKGKKSSVLINEVTSVNPVSKPLDIGFLEKNKPKKKLKSAQHADSLKENHAVEIESADKGSADVTIGSDKTKGNTKKNNKRVAGLKVANDETITDIAGIDAPVTVNVSDKAIGSDSGTAEKVEAKDVTMLVPCNNSTNSLIKMDQAGTEKQGMLETLESGVKRSKKRKNSGDDVSHQIDIKGSEELGVPDIGDMEKGTKKLAEFGMTRPSKRKKIEDDLPAAIKMDSVVDEKSDMLNSKQNNQTQKSKKKIKKKQNPAVENISEFAMRHESGDTREPEKSKPTLSKSAAEKDDNIDNVSLVSASQADPVINTKARVDEVIIPNNGSDVDLQHREPETSKPTLSKSAAEKDDNIDNVSLISASQADPGINTKAQVDEVLIPNNESEVSLQQKADDTCQNDVEPIQLAQVKAVKRGRCDTENKSVQTKKKTKQKQTREGKSIQKVVEGDKDDSRNGISLDKDLEIAPAEVSLNAAKNKGNEKKSSGPKNLPKSTNIVQQDMSMDFSSAKKQNATDPINPQVEGSALMGQSTDTEQQNRSISSAKQHAAANIQKSKIESSSLKTKDSGSLLNNIASARVENKNGSRTSSSHSDILNKRLHQEKSTKELPKMKQNQSSLRKSSDKSAEKVVHNPTKKKSLISMCGSIFKDDESSSEDEGGEDASNSSTETTDDDQVSSSDYSEDESRGSWASPKHGKSENGGSVLNFKSMDKNLTMESVLKGSQKYKKAKLIASKLQLEEDESQAVDVVPDSQANT